MTKAAPLSLGFILLLAAAAMLPAQTSPTDTAVNEAVLRQANTIILRQKLLDAKSTALRGDLPGAAKLYETPIRWSNKSARGPVSPGATSRNPFSTAMPNAINS